MKIKFFRLRRIAYVAVALALVWAATGQGLLLKRAYAFPVGAQVQQRQIKMSSSQASATGVSYEVTFKAATNHTMMGFILDFCDGTSTPIIGDSTCSAPAAPFSVGASPTISVSGAPNNLGGTWTTSSLNSNRTLKAVETTTGVSLIAGNSYTFTLTGVTNTATQGTFYARFITYTSASGDIASYAPGTEGSTDATDYGGFALSINNIISILAKVQETLTFCVSGLAPGPSCGQSGQAVTTPSLVIGNGTSANVLDTGGPYTAQAFTQTSTNANGGVIIRIRNTSASGGLNAGSNVIPATGFTPAPITAGVANFGLFVANGSGGTGTITADCDYNDGTSTHYAMDITTTTSGTGCPDDLTSVLTTYGDPIAASTLPVNSVGNTLTFAATASNTTPAGLYRADIIVVATGSF